MKQLFIKQIGITFLIIRKKQITAHNNQMNVSLTEEYHTLTN